MQHFAHCVIPASQVIENKYKNFGTELALKGTETLAEDVWVPQIVRRLHHES